MTNEIYCIENKQTGVQDYCDQTTIDKITELKLWNVFKIVPNPKNKDKKSIIEPHEIAEFINSKTIDVDGKDSVVKEIKTKPHGRIRKNKK